MSSLREKAAELAGRDDAETAGGVQPPDGQLPAATRRLVVEGAPLPDFEEFEPGEGDPEQVPAHIAWNRLMRDVRQIAKAGTFKAERGNQTWNYRGADHVVNEFGPAQRKHGIIIAPIRIETSYTNGSSKGGSAYRECTITVTWVVQGPAGDMLPYHPVSAAEAQDYADRSTTKAQTVALRTLLTTLAMVPTGSPDPESEYIERGEAQIRTPLSYADEILNESTSPGRLWQIKQELAQHKQAGALVRNELGQEESVLAMCTRIGQQRYAAKQAAQQPTSTCERCDGPHHSDACPTLDGGAS